MALERNATFLELFIELTGAMTASLSLDKVFGLITQKIPEIMNVDAATVRLLDPAGKKLILQAAHGLSREYLNRGAIDTEEPVFKALAGEPLVIEDAGNDTRIKYPQETQREGIHAILLVPIPIRGEISGVLRLLSKKPRSFDADEIKFAAALGAQCGIAIENARTFEEQQKQLNYLKAINEIAKTISATCDLDTILRLIVTRVPDVMDLKAATIRLIESPKGSLKLKAAHGLSRQYLERGPLDEELATYYVKQGDPVVIWDAKKDIHTSYHKEAESEGIGSILAVPITVQDDIIGILRLLTAQIHHFTPAEINFAMAVAEHGGLAIQRAIDREKMGK